MAHYELRISGDTSEPGDLQILALLGGAQLSAGPAPVDASGLSAAAEKPVRGKKKTEPEVGAVEAATAASPATERPSPAVQQTAEQIAHVDPAVLAAQQGGDPASPGSPSNSGNAAAAQTNAQSGAAATTNSPEANSGVSQPQASTAAAASPSETVTGEVTRDMLNAGMTELLKVTSAAKAQATIAEAAGGKKALGALDVSEYPAVLQALKNATATASAA